MGGWEIVIALFGGAWYVFSAIAAAKEKKKKQAQRKTLLDAESLANSTQSETSPLKTPAKQQDGEVSLREKSDLLTQLTPQSTKVESATLKTGGDDISVMREARKAILESMRKELGLTPSKPAPSAAPAPQQPLPRQVSAQPARPAPPMPPGPTGLNVPPARPLDLPPVISPKKPKRRRQQSAAPTSAASVVSPAHSARRSEQARDLQSLLKSRSGLQQAVLMAEIIQPPVSLRQQHLAG